MKTWIAILALCGAILFSPGSYAKDFTPQNAGEFQSALTEAAANNEHDTINLPSGTYSIVDNGNQGFVYDSSENYDLEIIGAGPGLTVLTGENTDGVQIALLKTTGDQARISVEGITIQDGLNGPGDGTGIEIETQEGDVNFFNNEIKGITAPEVAGMDLSTHGGDIAIRRSFFLDSQAPQTSTHAAHAGFFGTILFEENVVRGNTAGDQAGISLQSSDGAIMFRRNWVVDNHSDSDAGGIRLTTSDGDIYFSNNIVAGNTAAAAKGGAYLVPNGGDIYAVHNTIVNNSADTEGGGLYLRTKDEGVTYLYNNIVYGNTTAAGKGADIYFDDIFETGPSIVVFNNDFSEACFDSGGCDLAAFGADHGDNLDTDPAFVDAPSENFYLREDSLLIDSGLETIAGGIDEVDLLGRARLVGVAPDMGALEWEPEPEVPSPIPPQGPGISAGTGGCQLGGENGSFGLWCLFAFVPLALRLRRHANAIEA